ncbi:SUKH-4 family immunity protein [Streptomyces sp. NPDC059373]
MPETPEPVEVLPADEAIDRVLEWWRGGRRDGKRVAVVGGTEPERVRVLREVHRQVPGSLLLDAAAGRSQEELLADVMDHLGIPDKQRRYPQWRRALERQGKDRLVLLTGIQRAGLTRRSAAPSRVLGDLVTSLTLSGIGVVTEAVPDPDIERGRAIGIRLLGSPEDTGALPALLRVLALSEPRRVPLPVWRFLAEGAGLERPETAELLALTERHPEVLAVEDPDGSGDPVVAFRDEEVAESLRRDAERTDPDILRRTGAHLTRRLREAAPDFRHPAGWAASGPVGAYAAAGLAMHTAQAGRFEADLLGDGEAIANIPRTGLLDAARCAFGAEGLPGGNAAADANYLALYGVAPASQPEWAAWLHLMATARGDTALASAITGSGIALPWTVKWTLWRPPGGYDPAYLRYGAVNDLVEVRWQGRPAVAVIGDQDGAVRIHDPHTAQRLAGPWYEGDIPAADRAALNWPEPEEHDEPGPVSTEDLEDAADSADGPSAAYDYWLDVRLQVDGVVLLAGEGGLIALEPDDPKDPDGFAGIEPCHRTLLAPALSAPAAAPYATTPPPSPADLAGLLGPETVHRTASEALPPALTDDSARRVLTGPGLPELDEQGLGLQPRHQEFLHEVPWPADLPAPDTAGPFFRIGQWMGGLLVLDGPTGAVLRIPAGLDEPGLEGSLVAADLERFLTMTAEWIVGHRTLARIGGREEPRLIRQEIEGRLWLIDHVGSASKAWTYALYND